MSQEELGERVPTSFDFDVGFYRGSKQVWMRSDNDMKQLSILKEKPEECVLWCMGRSTKKSRDHRNSSEESEACHEVTRKSKKKKTTYED